MSGGQWVQPEPVSAPSAADRAEQPKRGQLHHLWQIISWLLLIAAVAILAATIVIPRIAGAQTYTVLTGSMQPDYPPGSLIVVKPRSAEKIAPGDVITYQIRSGDPEVVTHRVIEVTQTDAGEPRFITQGDANDIVDDDPVRPVQVRGALWYSIPYLGYVNTWFTGNRRSIVVFVLAGLLFVYAAAQFYLGYREDKSDKTDGDDNDMPDVSGAATEPDPGNADAPTVPIEIQSGEVQTPEAEQQEREP